MNASEPKKPTCIGFIMDGNRRWAREQGLDTVVGHQAGAEVLKQCVDWLTEAGIAHAVFYAFSTENWGRSEVEVAALIQLFRTELASLIDRSVRVKFIGRRADFPTDLISEMRRLEEKSAQYKQTTVWIALSYGGRSEIVRAVNAAIKSGEQVTEESFAELLDTADMPDPDVIVRTGGEQRLSNFLPWQSTYSELVFIDTHWPALTQEQFKGILETYGSRKRRRGT